MHYPIRRLASSALCLLLAHVGHAAALVLKRGVGDELRIVKADAGSLTAEDPAIANSLMWPKVGYRDQRLTLADRPESGSGVILRTKEDGKSNERTKQNVFGATLDQSFSVKYSCWIKPQHKTRCTIAVFIWHVAGKQSRILIQYLGPLDVRGYQVSFSTPIKDFEREGSYSFHVFEIDQQTGTHFEYSISDV